MWGHLPITSCAWLLSIVSLSPLILRPSTVVPILVARSSIVRRDRLERSWAWPGSTSSTVIVKCFRDIVLWEISSCPAGFEHTQHKRTVTAGAWYLRSEAVRPKRYVLPGLSQSCLPAPSSTHSLQKSRARDTGPPNAFSFSNSHMTVG